jgi:hypothetical protein
VPSGILLAVFAVGLLASGCDWNELAANPGLNGDNAADTAITPSNVSTLTEQFVASDGSTGAVTPRAVVNGTLYVSDAAGLEAYSATGSSGCSGTPTTCSPLWSYPGISVPTSGGVAVLNGVLYVTTATALEAFDASGHTNCAGTPAACSPLWHATLSSPSAPTVSNGMVYLTASGTLDAFDASGVTDCSGGVCAPEWTSSSATGPVAISAGIAYVVGGSGVVALDATGSRGCSGTPKVCTPLWTYPTPAQSLPGGPPEQGNLPVRGYPVVSGTTLYVESFAGLGVYMQGGLEGFDANGVADCGGTPVVCSPEWSGGAPTLLPPLVANGVAFSGASTGSPFAAFEDGGSQWLSSSGGGEPVAVGGSVLYAVGSDGVSAFDAAGSAGCSGDAPKTCSPLWSAPGTGAIVANGTLYVSTTNASGGGEIVAYGLP